MIFPVVVLAQTPEVKVTSAQPAATVTSPQCGVTSFEVGDECGAGVYKYAYVQCSDGYKPVMGSESSCKPADLWNQYAKETCAGHCSSGGGSVTVSTPVSAPVIYAGAGDDTGGGNRSTPLVSQTQKPAETKKATPVCYISDGLMQRYNELIVQLQKSESDKTRAEEITQQIIALKQQIAKQQEECSKTVTSQPAAATSPVAAKNVPVSVSIDRCSEVAQWETKIAYYKKISSLNDDSLSKSGFSRDEIEKILQELSQGIEKVRAQCGSQEKVSTTPRATAVTGSAAIAQTVKPVVLESGQEIGVYYKARLEKASSIKGEEKQIQELKTLRDEIDGLISNLIKSRKELEVNELNSLVKEVKVSPGEIKADGIAVKTTEKKMLVNVGDRPVSVEPATSQVLIRDKGLEVSTDEVMIKKNVLSVGGIDVIMSASEVAEKHGLAPKTIELKQENAKAVYNIKIEERRKLFGFIPFNRSRIVTADAGNGNVLSAHLPWYYFMTTK